MATHFVYVLQSLKDKKFYIGYTKDLVRRLEHHKKGLTPSTKYRRPLELIFYEAYLSQRDALRREDYFKTTPGKRALKIMLKSYLEGKKSI